MHELILPILNIFVLCLIFWLSRGQGLVGTLSGFSAKAPGASVRFMSQSSFADRNLSSGRNRFMSELSRFATGGKPPSDTIYLLWGSYCHFCRDFKDPSKGGKWPMFKTRALNQGLQVREIQIDGEITADDRTALEKIGPYRGVPYVVRIATDGKVEPYEGPREDEPMMAWALRV